MRGARPPRFNSGRQPLATCACMRVCTGKFVSAFVCGCVRACAHAWVPDDSEDAGAALVEHLDHHPHEPARPRADLSPRACVCARALSPLCASAKRGRLSRGNLLSYPPRRRCGGRPTPPRPSAWPANRISESPPANASARPANRMRTRTSCIVSARECATRVGAGWSASAVGSHAPVSPSWRSPRRCRRGRRSRR